MTTKQNLTTPAYSLLMKIRADGGEAKIAALQSDYEDLFGWEQLIDLDLVNRWMDDSGQRFVEEGKQQ